MSARCHLMSLFRVLCRWIALCGLLGGGQVEAFPRLVDFGPRTGGPGTTVTLTGSGLGTVTEVNFGGGAAATIIARDTTFVRVIVPIEVLNGPINVTDVNGFGDDTGAHGLPDFLAPPRMGGFQRTIPAPISTADGFRGAPGNTVRIDGANFNSVSDSSFASSVAVGFTGVNGILFVTPASTGSDFVDAVVPPGAISGPLTVVTRIGRETSLTDFFFQPFITRFTATAAVGQTNEIIGVSLKGATLVMFGDLSVVPKTVSPTNITVIVPAVTGPVRLTVITPGGVAQSVALFSVLPSISSFSPLGGAIGTLVTLTGTGFSGATKVRFGLLDSAVLTASATQVTTKVPPGAVSGRLTIFTPEGTNTTTSTFFLPPKLTSVNPTRAKVGDQVSLIGTGLVGLGEVRFAGVTAIFSVVNDLSVLATVPTGAITGSIVISNAGGTNTPGLPFSVLGNEPVIESFTPESGAPGTIVTLTGFNFTGTVAVNFGSSTVPAVFTVKSDTNLMVTVPSGAQTGAITVRNSLGTGHSLKNFTAGTSAALNLALSANPTVVLPGEPLVLQVQVHNSGPLPASGVSVTVTLTDGLDYLDSTLALGTINLLVDGFLWDVGIVGLNQTLVSYIRLQPRFSGDFPIVAQAKSLTVDPNLEDNFGRLTVTAAQPALRVVVRSANQLTLAWSARATNFFLQRTGQLGDAIWNGVTNVPIPVLDEVQVDVPLQGQAGWYRLGPP